VKVVEKQRLFQMDGKFGIMVVSDLGKTPYAKSFDPLVQIMFVENGDRVEYLARWEMVWKNHPFVKSIIQNKTQEEIKELYYKYGQKLIGDLGGQVEEEGDGEGDGDKEGPPEDDFAKPRAIYKIVIIALNVVLLLVIWIQHGRKRGFGISAHGLMTFLVILTFFGLLVFF
jgi:hypothetical protein